MKITPRATRAFLGSAATLLAFLVWCQCTCPTVHARSHRLKMTSVVNDTDPVTNCDLVRPFFVAKNITFIRTAENFSKTTCGGKCCSEEMEMHLKQQARADFHNLIHHHSRSLQGLFATTADTLRETVIVLLRRSENITLNMFDQVYRSMAVLSRPSIRALYQAMVNYVSPSDDPDRLQQLLTRDTLQERFAEFFRQLFPIAYHYAIKGDKQDFTERFKSCLYETMDDIRPFGNVPQDIFKNISRSLEVTRVLVQALMIGNTVLDRTDSVLFAANSALSPQQEACYDALLRLTYCPRCKGIRKDVQPCTGFCTNVMRGCLTEPASELDLAWSGYVETVERLVSAVDGDTEPGLNVKNAVRELDSHISNAIMHAMEEGPDLEEKVRKVCGRSELLPPKSPTSDMATKLSASNGEVHPTTSSLLPRSHDDLLDKLHKQLGNFLASVVRSRIFYGTLADAICEDNPEKHCWNGERVGEYTKTVVDASLNAQRYNPEFTITMSSMQVTYVSNTNTSALIDQLRHINQVVQSQLPSAADNGPDAFQGDEALDGSGSGDMPSWRHETDDDEDGRDDNDEASGSGMGPTTADPSIKGTNVPGHVGSSTILLPSMVTLVIAYISLIA